MSPDNSLDQHVVTAVVVAHDGAGWIPRMAEGVLQQTRPVQRAVAVDTGSRDRSGAMLAGLFGRAAVFGMDRGTGYAAAVTHALRHRAANMHVPGAQPGERTEWVWLIHDDCEPAPDALELLLRAATGTPAAAVLGPKVMDWTDRRVILEAGLAIDRAGRRVTGLEPREVDQGQHDGDRDVLAVSSPGMLIRRDVWDQLGGFDTGMRLFREDVDFCWRAQAAGHRVRLVTDAVVYHLEASARNRRSTSAAPRPRRQDRRNALITLLGNLPAGPMTRVLAGNALLSVLRTLFYLVAKRPGAGVDEFTALLSVAGHPFRLLSARRPRARGRRAGYGRVRASIPPARTLGRLAEFAAAALSKSASVDTIGSHHATDDPTDDDSLLTDTGFGQRLLTSPGVLLFIALTTVTLVAERSLLGGGPLGGGALTPGWGGASDLWSEYLQGFHPAGIGSAASTPPYVAVIAFLATLLAGKTWLAVDAVMIGCVPLAGLTAYLVARRVTRFVPARVWAAAAYALLPVGMGAVAAGRLGMAVVFVLLPVIGLLIARIFTQPRRRARRAAWAVALVTAVAASFVPLVWLVAGVAVVIGGLTFGRSRPGVGLNLVIVAAVPLLLLVPWSLQLAASPVSMFLESGLQQPGLSQAPLPPSSLLLLSPGGPGLPPHWVTAGLLLAALVTALASGRRPAVLAGWGVALAGLLVAVGASQLVITPPGGGQAIPAWPGAMLAFAGGGLVLAAAAGGDSLPGWLGKGRWRSPAGLGVLLLALAACSAPALAAATWVTRGVRGPVAQVAAPVLPEFVSVSSSSGLRPRTLVLRPGAHGAVSYEVLRGADPLIGESSLTPVPAAGRALNTTVAALVAPSGGEAQDQGRALAGFGIGYVLLPSPGSPALTSLLDGVAGLRSVSQTASFQLWRVVDTVARVRVQEAGGKVVPVPSGAVGVSGAAVPPGAGELVLAEPAGGWSATVNGQPLTPLAAPVGGWAQGFRLPAGGGTLSIGHSQLGRDAIVLLEGLAVLAVAGLGLPGARVAGEETEEGADSRRPGSSRARGRAGDRQPARRGRPAAAVPDARGPGPETPAGEQLAGRAAGLAAAAAAYRDDSGPMAPARPRRPGDDVAGAPGRSGTRAGYPGGAAPGTGYPDEALDRGPAAAGARRQVPGPRGAPPGRGFPAGGGLAPLPPASGAAGGSPPGGRPARGRGATEDDPGRRSGRRSGGLLGRGRGGRGGQDEPAAAGAGPPEQGTRSSRRLGRGREGPRGPAAEPGGVIPRGRFPGDDADRPAAASRRGAGGYGRGGPPPEFDDLEAPAGRGRPDTRHPDARHPDAGYPDAGYPDAGYPADPYGSGEYPADRGAGSRRPGSRGGRDRDDYDSGSYRRGDDTGGYSTGSYEAGAYGTGDDGSRSRRGGRRGAGGRGQGGGHGVGDDRRDSRGYPAADGGGYGAAGGDDRRDGGRRGRRSRRGAGQGDAGRDGAGRDRAGRDGAGRDGAGRDGGGRDDGYRGAGGGHGGGDYDTGGYPAGDYPAGGHGSGGYDTGGYPAGDYPAGGHGSGGYDTGGYPAGGYDTGEYGAGEYGAGDYGDDGDARGGRRKPPPGRGRAGRGKPGRRAGRGDR